MRLHQVTGHAKPNHERRPCNKLTQHCDHEAAGKIHEAFDGRPFYPELEIQASSFHHLMAVQGIFLWEAYHMPLKQHAKTA